MQPIIDFEVEGTHNYVAAGVVHHNSGKSDALAYCVSYLARFGTPERPYQPTTGWVTSLDFPSSRDIVQPKIFDNGFVPGGAKPFIPAREIDDWRVSDQILKLKNGSIIGFKSSDSGRTKFQGAEKDYVAEDEEQPEDVHEESIIRVGAGRRLRTFGAVTLLPPEGAAGGVSWMFPKLIQPFLSGELTGVGLFGASIYDNPHLPYEEIKRLESVYPEGSIQRRIRLGGEWLPGLSGARCYAAFDRKLHVRPQPPIFPRRPLCWIWDFNIEPMISLVGQREGRLFRVLREFVLDEGQISEMVDWFRSQIPKHYGEVWVYGDATGKRRTNQTGQSDYALILNHMRNYGALRLKVPEDNPLVRDRVNAVNMACRNEFGELNLEIDPSCKELIADLEQVVADAKGGIRKTTNRRDPYFRRTHTSDALGYWISYEQPVKTSPVAHSMVRIPTPGYAVG